MSGGWSVILVVLDRPRATRREAKRGVPNTWITDMTNYLDDTGGIAAMPGRVRRLADHFGTIVAAASALTPGKVVRTHVSCRRRPGRRPCAGRIQAIRNAEDRIRWQCPSCGDNGLISGWRGTPWDMRRVGRLQ